jgi:hypothetical protein
MNGLLDSLISIGGGIAVIISGIVAAVALWYSSRTLREVKNSQQFNIINSVLNDINQIDSEVPNLFQLHKDKNDNELSEVAFTQLLTKLFNKLDWISFLINHDQIKNRDIQEYLNTMIKTHFEQTFEELATDNMKEPSEFKELKKLYQKIKS